MELSDYKEYKENEKSMPPMTEEEANAYLDSILDIKIPDYIKSFFGQNLINELINLSKNGFTREIDLLYLTGELNEQEIYQYSFNINDFKEHTKEIEALQVKLLNKLSQKIPFYLEKTFDKRFRLNKKINIMKLFEAIDYLSIDFKSNKKIPTYLYSMLLEFRLRLKSMLMLNIIKQIEKEEMFIIYKAIYVNALSTIVENIHFNEDHKQIVILNLIKTVKYFLNILNNKYSETFKRFNEQSHIDEENLQDWNKLQFEEISDLLTFRKLETLNIDFENISIIIESIDTEEKNCFIKICFNDEEMEKNENGSTIPQMLCRLDFATGKWWHNNVFPLEMIIEDIEKFTSIIFGIIHEKLINTPKQFLTYLLEMKINQ